jgi:hypothetical protein
LAQSEAKPNNSALPFLPKVLAQLADVGLRFRSAPTYKLKNRLSALTKSTTGISHLALVPNCQYQYRILVSLKTIKRNITGFAVRDNQFAQVRFDRTSHQRVALQYVERLFDQFNRFRRSQWISLQQGIGQPFKVKEREVRID